MKELEIVSLYDLSHTLAAPYLSRFTYPWEALAGLSDFIVELGRSLPAEEYEEIGEKIWAAKSAVIAPTASLTGPVIIGKNSQVRHCAFLRGSILVGETCVVGNSTELKNVILFDHVQVPHYNYVGDSVLGYKAHLGAGAITSNVKSDKTPVAVKHSDTNTVLNTELRKFGAVVGDYTEVGCNTVLCPGTIIGRECIIYPQSRVRGVVNAGSIYKDAEHIIKRQ